MAIITGQLDRIVFKNLHKHMQHRKVNNFATHDKRDLMIIVVDVSDIDEISHIRIVGANQLIPSELDAIEEIFMSCFEHNFVRYEEKSKGNELHLVPEKILPGDLSSEDMILLIQQAQVRMDETPCLQEFISYIFRATQKLTDEICLLFEERQIRRLKESFLPAVAGLKSFATMDSWDICILRESYTNKDN